MDERTADKEIAFLTMTEHLKQVNDLRAQKASIDERFYGEKDVAPILSNLSKNKDKSTPLDLNDKEKQLTQDMFVLVMDSICACCNGDRDIKKAGQTLHLSRLFVLNMQKLDLHAKNASTSLEFAKTEAVRKRVSFCKDDIGYAPHFDEVLTGASAAVRVAQNNVHACPFLMDSSGFTEFNMQDDLHKLATTRSFTESVTRSSLTPVLAGMKPYTSAVSHLQDVALVELARSKGMLRSSYRNFVSKASDKISDQLSGYPLLVEDFKSALKEVEPVALDSLLSFTPSMRSIQNYFVSGNVTLEQIKPARNTFLPSDYLKDTPSV